MARTLPLEWIPAGKTYSFEDVVFWHGKDIGKPFEELVGQIDTIVSGPHASAAFPEELKPFVSDALTRRKQHDYSDVITGPVGRAWVACDPHVVFVENPHSRVVLDPNRARPDNVSCTLKECFSRLRRQRAGESDVTFNGVDAVRPVTFSAEDVLMEPQNDGEWQECISALSTAAELGPLKYSEALEQVFEIVLAARSEGSLTFVALHDTNNFKMRPDGALVIERPAADRLPSFVNFGNLGDAVGDAKNNEPTSTAGPQMRSIAAAWGKSFGLEQDFMQPAEHAYEEHISFNRPYGGGHELREWSTKFREAGFERIKAFQVEFERGALLGPIAAEALLSPGEDWPHVDVAHVQAVAQKLKVAADYLRESQTGS